MKKLECTLLETQKARGSFFQGDRFEDWGDSTDDEQSKEIERLDRPHDDGSQNYHGRTGERS